MQDSQQPSNHQAAHDHAHGHAHAHAHDHPHAPGGIPTPLAQPATATPRPARSLLMLGAPQRLAAAACLLTLLWLAVAWALAEAA